MSNLMAFQGEIVHIFPQKQGAENESVKIFNK